jgi:hypothetical protein
VVAVEVTRHIVREIREELGAEIADIGFLATLDRTFELEGRTRREIQEVFEAWFADPSFYERVDLRVLDDPAADVVWSPSRRW